MYFLELIHTVQGNTMQTTSLRIERRKEVCHRTGLPPTTLFYRISAGLFPRPIPLGAKIVGWPAHEVDQVIKAMIACKTEPELKELVSQLEASRQL